MTGTRLVLGTMTFGAQVDRAAARTMLDACVEAGVREIDTANVYVDGVAEEVVGELIRGRRDEFTVATKVGLPTEEAGGDPLLSPAAIRRCVDASLRRLGTDHVDLYYLHRPDRDTPVADTLATMSELVRDGKVLRVGVSNYAAWQLADIDATAAVNGFVRPMVSQVLYNLLGRRIEDEYAEFSATHGLANVVYNPLAGGLLTGKHAAGSTPADGRFGTGGLGSQYRERYWHDATFTAVTALTGIAADAGLTLLELAYRWLASRREVDAIVLGASSPAQLTANLAAATGPPLTEDVLSACDDVWARLRGPAPAYNR